MTYLTSTLASAVRKGLLEVLAPFDLTPMQWSILDVCSREQANTVSGIAKVVPSDTPAISRHVEMLVNRGLIVRRRSTNDRRTVRLTLTKEAAEMMPQITRSIEANNATFLQRITRKEAETFMAIMRKILAGELEDPDPTP